MKRRPSATGTTSAPTHAGALLLIELATWFVAWFSIDQWRIEDGRNGSAPCIRHQDFKPNAFSQRNILQANYILLV